MKITSMAIAMPVHDAVTGRAIRISICKIDHALTVDSLGAPVRVYRIRTEGCSCTGDREDWNDTGVMH